MVVVEQRRICWPDFDNTCLEGGCQYCNGNPFRSVASIERAVQRRADQNADGGLMQSFDRGHRHRWGNAESRTVRMKR
jgi:hypothetical protein